MAQLVIQDLYKLFADNLQLHHFRREQLFSKLAHNVSARGEDEKEKKD